jgi:hypothetical protein
MNDPILHAKTKHIELHHHYIREKVKKNVIEVVYIPNQEQDVDNFTKLLGKTKFQTLRNKNGIYNLEEFFKL